MLKVLLGNIKENMSTLPKQLKYCWSGIKHR